MHSPCADSPPCLRALRDEGIQSSTDILLRFRAGDPKAVQAVLCWIRNTVHSTPHRVPCSDRDDVVQETMMSLWLAVLRKSFLVRTDFCTLVRRIATMRCIDWHRRRINSCSLGDSLPDPHPDPHTRLSSLEDLHLLRRALAGLNSGTREILRLHFFEDLSYAAIADLFDRSSSTVRVRAFLALKSLRRDLDRSDHNLPLLSRNAIRTQSRLRACRHACAVAERRGQAANP